MWIWIEYLHYWTNIVISHITSEWARGLSRHVFELWNPIIKSWDYMPKENNIYLIVDPKLLHLVSALMDRWIYQYGIVSFYFQWPSWGCEVLKGKYVISDITSEWLPKLVCKSQTLLTK